MSIKGNVENDGDTDGSAEFTSGLALSEAYYFELVKPLLLNGKYADLRYSAALIGNGSEVLGFDTEMSSDHCWGPRLLLFLESEDFSTRKDELNSFLEEKLPQTFKGFATHFDAPPVSFFIQLKVLYKSSWNFLFGKTKI